MISRAVSLTLALSMIACTYTVKHIQVSGIKVQKAGLRQKGDYLIIQKNLIRACEWIEYDKVLYIYFDKGAFISITCLERTYLKLIQKKYRFVHFVTLKELKRLIEFLVNADITARRPENSQQIEGREYP
ncbi:MAG: hypothetical protein ACFFDN_19895 [Candidatus Hodarchaeota archaeon]